MTKLSINNLKGEKVSDITLNSEVFGIEVNELAMKKMVRLQLNASRQGTAKVKTRSIRRWKKTMETKRYW